MRFNTSLSTNLNSKEGDGIYVSSETRKESTVTASVGSSEESV